MAVAVEKVFLLICLPYISVFQQTNNIVLGTTRLRRWRIRILGHEGLGRNGALSLVEAQRFFSAGLRHIERQQQQQREGNALELAQAQIEAQAQVKGSDACHCSYVYSSSSYYYNYTSLLEKKKKEEEEDDVSICGNLFEGDEYVFLLLPCLSSLLLLPSYPIYYLYLRLLFLLASTISTSVYYFYLHLLSLLPSIFIYFLYLHLPPSTASTVIYSLGQSEMPKAVAMEASASEDSLSICHLSEGQSAGPRGR